MAVSPFGLPILMAAICGIGFFDLFPVEGLLPDPDCLSSITPESEPGGTVVVDTGTTMSTNGAGCDGCTVATIKIKVTWAYDSGGASVEGPGFASMLGHVDAGQSDTYSWIANQAIACDSHKFVLVSQPFPEGSPSGGATLRFNCSACQ